VIDAAVSWPVVFAIAELNLQPLTATAGPPGGGSVVIAPSSLLPPAAAWAKMRPWKIFAEVNRRPGGRPR
jgi:hypothetical protein